MFDVRYFPEHPVYGLIGRPLGHSFSAEWFNKYFAEHDIDAVYRNMEIEKIEDVIDILYFKHDIVGLNVTSPYKKSIMRYMDGNSYEAEMVGAVNVVRITNDIFYGRSFSGHNTDVEGFTTAVTPLLTPAMTRALVLGTGGAAAAAMFALKQMGIEAVQVSRTPKDGQLGYCDIDKTVMDTHLLVINATPLGMEPHVDEAPALPYDLFTPEHLAYDMIYNPAVTKFMRLAAEYGARTENGLKMLISQAEASMRIWQMPADFKRDKSSR